MTSMRRYLFVAVFFSGLASLAVELSARDLEQIESAAAKIQVEGDRYPEHIEKMTGL